jgi:hypothetical protein
VVGGAVAGAAVEAVVEEEVHMEVHLMAALVAAQVGQSGSPTLQSNGEIFLVFGSLPEFTVTDSPLVWLPLTLSLLFWPATHRMMNAYQNNKWPTPKLHSRSAGHGSMVRFLVHVLDLFLAHVASMETLGCAVVLVIDSAYGQYCCSSLLLRIHFGFGDSHWLVFGLRHPTVPLPSFFWGVSQYSHKMLCQ